jgi:hypothetical protein
MNRKAWLAIPILLLWTLAGCRGSILTDLGDGTYYRDDFSDPASGWDRVSGDDGVTDYTKGAYRIFSELPDYYLWATSGKQYPTDVRIEVDVTQTAGTENSLFGILCRYQDTGNFYILMISGDGQAGIAKVQSGGGPFLLSGDVLARRTEILAGFSTNHLQADCAGNELSLYVNGALAASASDSSFSGGDAGLWLGDKDFPGAEVLFDNFLIRIP